MRPERFDPARRRRLRRRVRLALAAVMAVLIGAFAWSWHQVRAEKAAQAAALAQSRANAAVQPQALPAIFANDDTVPAAPYFAALVPGENQALGDEYRFPIQTRLLRPGVLATEGVPVFNPKWMTHTLAVVGDDAASLACRLRCTPCPRSCWPAWWARSMAWCAETCAAGAAGANPPSSITTPSATRSGRSRAALACT
jgi:hypothetical protein